MQLSATKGNYIVACNTTQTRTHEHSMESTIITVYRGTCTRSLYCACFVCVCVYMLQFMPVSHCIIMPRAKRWQCRLVLTFTELLTHLFCKLVFMIAHQECVRTQTYAYAPALCGSAHTRTGGHQRYYFHLDANLIKRWNTDYDVLQTE